MISIGFYFSAKIEKNKGDRDFKWADSPKGFLNPDLLFLNILRLGTSSKCLGAYLQPKHPAESLTLKDVGNKLSKHCSRLPALVGTSTTFNLLPSS